MLHKNKIGLVIPTLNEEYAIGRVIADVPNWVDTIMVADNGSTDATVTVARRAGAEIAYATRQGYGAACLAGIDALKKHDVVVFLDGDYSDYPQQMDRVVHPILHDNIDLVIGSRKLGSRAKSAMTIQQRFGNFLACWLIKLFWNVRYTDLGPFRAIRWDALSKLNMSDQAYGWTVQMQLRAIQENLNVLEVPVDYRVRIGQSKISGTLKGVFWAGYTIISTILFTALSDYWIKKTKRHLPYKHQLGSNSQPRIQLNSSEDIK